MTGFVMTQVSTPIIGQAAWLLGKVMDGIYRVMNGVFGIQNIGICIILLMSAAMNPEIQKIQKKYQGKKDQASMEKMQEETQLVYEKYGVSPTSGCLPMFIQFPFLWAMWYVIRGIPAYVSQVKDVYTPLIEGITSTNGW